MAKKRKQQSFVIDPELERIGYDKTPTFILMVFWVYVVAWFLQLGSRIHFLGAIRIELVLAVSLVGLSFMVRRQRIKIKSNLPAFIAGYYFFVSITLLYSYDPDSSWTIYVDRFVKFSFMAFFIVLYVRSPLTLLAFLSAFLLAFFKLGQEGMVGQITGSLVWENQGVMRLNGPTPLYSHPNSFSGMALGTLPFIYYLFPLSNKWIKLFFAILLVFSFNIILHAGSRTTYVGFFALVAYFLLKSDQKFKFFTIAAIVFVVALPFVPEQYIERFQSITGHEKEGHSKERRQEIIADALVIFSEHPFGVGVAAFPKVRTERFGRFQDTHNLYLEIATNFGIQGFIFWICMIVAIFRNISRLRTDINGQVATTESRAPPAGEEPSPISKHLRDLKVMRAVLNAIEGYLVVRLVVGVFGHDTYEIYWWVILGNVIAIHNMNQVAARITKYYAQGAAKKMEHSSNQSLDNAVVNTSQ